MTAPSADEVYDQFKSVLRTTVDDYDNPVLKFQCENGMADWSLNDEGHELLANLNKRDIAKLLCHIIVLTSGAEERYMEDLEAESTAALESIENDDESSEDEKILATELIEVAALAQADGFTHCVALVYGWALAAIAADEGDSVDWDSFFGGDEVVE